MDFSINMQESRISLIDFDCVSNDSKNCKYDFVLNINSLSMLVIVISQMKRAYISLKL